MTEKRRYRTGKGRQSETPQEVLAPGDADRMSILAKEWSVKKCGLDGCTRPSGHADREDSPRSKSVNPHHASRQHVAADRRGFAEQVWYDDETGAQTA